MIKIIYDLGFGDCVEEFDNKSEAEEYFNNLKQACSTYGLKQPEIFYEKISTKHCPNCSNGDLVLMRTLNKKHCMTCGTDIDWTLEEHQEAVGYKKGN